MLGKEMKLISVDDSTVEFSWENRSPPANWLMHSHDCGAAVNGAKNEFLDLFGEKFN